MDEVHALVVVQVVMFHLLLIQRWCPWTLCLPITDWWKINGVCVMCVCLVCVMCVLYIVVPPHTNCYRHNYTKKQFSRHPHTHILSHRVGPAVRAGARYLDMGTSTLVRVLRQYPLARVAVFVYALLLHLYCYFLLSHMQRHAMNMEHGHMLMQDMQGVVKPEGTGAG